MEQQFSSFVVSDSESNIEEEVDTNLTCGKLEEWSEDTEVEN